MVRYAARWFLLIFPAFFASGALAQTPSTHVEPASNRAARTSPVAPLPQQLFGAIRLSTKSEDVRKSLEQAWDKYENAMYDPAADLARQAVKKDPQSAFSYALVSFAARRGMPDSYALAKAKALLPRATPDEQLLVRWMTAIQDHNLLPAIASMNDLLKRYPRDKHVLYVTGEWLFLQQDNDRARTLLETALLVDPNFPAALNRLGYLYLDSSNPDPAKAVASLKRYAEVAPTSPNPQDSLGEVLRGAGDDQGSIEHYHAALQIDSAYISSQYGIGVVRTLMGDFPAARQEFDRAIPMAQNPMDELYVKYLKTFVYFWEGKPAEGREAFAALAKEAAGKKEPNSQFQIGLAQAMLAADPQSELTQLKSLSAFLENPLAGMNESDRGIARAAVLRERARVLALQGNSGDASQALSELQSLATASRDQLIASYYESALGYLLAAKGDFQGAAEGLSADEHSPIVLQRLAAVQEKLGNAAAAEAARTCLKYHRSSEAEWFLATHNSAPRSN
ncbi:MAG TPA: tetratricopeptide repeat protein [Candidatus Acidoferrum sp.]|nr:tetratricopeptide repeat protein [Candidatus Acidoferrum sp.]